MSASVSEIVVNKEMTGSERPCFPSSSHGSMSVGSDSLCSLLYFWQQNLVQAITDIHSQSFLHCTGLGWANACFFNSNCSKHAQSNNFFVASFFKTKAWKHQLQHTNLTTIHIIYYNVCLLEIFGGAVICLPKWL